MGGGYYSGDIGERTRASDRDFFQYTSTIKAAPVEERKCHPSLDIRGKIRECLDSEEHPETHPIGIILDGTRSRGKDAGVIFAKLPMLMGQIQINEILPHPVLGLSVFGDTHSDLAPIQVGQWESDNRLDDIFSKMWLEEGGGGTGQESSELVAYYYAHRVKLDHFDKRGKKSPLFFLSDEGFYPNVSKSDLKKYLGVTVEEDISSSKVFADLQKKFDTYLIFPEQSWEDRKADIDEEIRQRVTAAGGKIDNVDGRFSAIWYNKNDLDIHVKTPHGDEIFYGSKRSRCGGELDVDANAGCGSNSTTKPVENVRWLQSRAPKGKYEVWVENYAFYDDRDGYDFRVECVVGGEITHFEGKIKGGKTGKESRVLVGTFNFDPDKKVDTKQTDEYAGYKDDVVLAQWANVIPQENILKIKSAKACVDTILGTIAITSGARKLEQYLKDMKTRGQTTERIEDVQKALKGLSELKQIARVNIGNAKTDSRVAQRKTPATRL